MARKTQNKAKAAHLLDGLDEYLGRADPPIAEEYAHEHGMTGAELRELAETERAAGRPALSRALDRLAEVKAIKLERGALSGHYKTTAAVFSLKELGWGRGIPDDGDGDDGAQGVILLGDVLEGSGGEDG